jgi:hypothetical protein
MKMFTNPTARFQHLSAAAAFHEAVQYRKAYLRHDAKGQYIPSTNFAAWTEKYTDIGKHHRANATLMGEFA